MLDFMLYGGLWFLCIFLPPKPENPMAELEPEKNDLLYILSHSSGSLPVHSSSLSLDTQPSLFSF